MTLGEFGLVLIRMAETAKERGNFHGLRREVEASAMMHSISFMLEAGASRCIEIAEEQADERQD